MARLSAPQPNSSALREEQINLLYTHGPSLLLGNTLGVIASTVLLWDNIAALPLGLWLAAVIALTAARVVMLVLHKGKFRPRLSSNTWGWLFAAGSGLSGIGWGVLGFLTMDADPLTLITVGMILAGLTGAAVPALSTFYPTYVLYASGALLPYAALGMLRDHPLALGISAVGISYYVCTLIFAWSNNRVTLASIRLRFENLTLLHQLREQTQAAEASRASAETANSGKTRFLAAASHDLRQPLQSITLLTEALDAEPLSLNGRRLLSSMREACISMGDLMDELMDYSRIDSGMLQAEFRAFDIAPILIRIEGEFAPIARQQGLELRVRHRSLRVRSDARMIERILRNLVSNALKYTNSGGVLVGCRAHEGKARLEVWDSGVGIPGDKQGDVFREFYQLDNPERDSRKGLGLGLAIVDGLAKLLGEQLELRSIPGRGSVFSINLPLDTVDARIEAFDRAVNAPLPIPNPRVLVIDNEPVIQLAMSSLLETWGCRPIAAESLEDALSRMDGPPDVILADYRLREGHTGIQAIEGVRRRFGHGIPAALITGDTDPHRLAEARASGFPLLQKPTPSTRLREVLASLLQTPVSPSPAPSPQF